MTDTAGGSSLMDDPYRFTGKPHKRVVARLESADLDALDKHFDGAKAKAYYLAHVIETAACWPRVLKGVMEQDRYHERTQRMLEAILRATISEPAL